MIEILRPATHEEWLSIRERGIGSSEISTILGLNPFQTPYQLWLRKRGEGEPIKENFAMKAGHYLEDAVSLFFRDATGAKIQKNSAGDFIVRDTECTFMQVSPDRYYKNANGKKCILECKTTQLQVNEDDVPKHWFVQLQYQLGVNQLEEGSLAWLTQGRDFGYRTFSADAELFDYLKGKVVEFWNNNVIAGIEPDPVSVQDVMSKYSIDNGSIVYADESILESINALRELKEVQKENDAKISKLEDAIKIRMGESSRLETQNGDLLATWKSGKPARRFDTERFKSENPAEYEKYVKEGSATRRFVLK